ncbi:MAG: MGMT family protein [Candidatus Pseudobacter hemicellulosilyticus]|uniref:MGMT family protein n=1 Tax=Candidatus Pseudobacter hemicellulosilyticus TaxID=3121375 RepID=A0AAJ6BID3_9BACT|nr:MAG: MGMT family protein [Pseudobacter sp.]
MASKKTKPAVSRSTHVSAKKKKATPVPGKVGPALPSGKKKAGTAPAREKSSSALSKKLNTVTPSGQRDSSFFELVFDVARQIPRGRVTSYGAIAAALGARSSSRMVGWAMNLAGSVTPKVPAHRVVNRNGMLSGKHHFGSPTRMQELLEKEGISVKEDKVVDFQKLFWDPADIML